MTRDSSILIIGGDERQKHLCDELKRKGHKCELENSDVQVALKKLETRRFVVLPIPVSADGKYIYCDNKEFQLELDELSDELTFEHITVGGLFSEKFRRTLDQKNIMYIDMNDNEEFLTYNAFLTAQGAVKLLLDSVNCLVTGKKVLITGFGRVAKALAQILDGVGTDVYICARNELQLTWARGMGYRTVDMKDMRSVVYLFDYIFNTVPERIFKETDVSHLGEYSMYFELASKPYGASREDFIYFDRHHIMANALPGRFLSYSAGVKIAEFIEKLI